MMADGPVVPFRMLMKKIAGWVGIPRYSLRRSAARGSMVVRSKLSTQEVSLAGAIELFGTLIFLRSELLGYDVDVSCSLSVFYLLLCPTKIH